MFMMRAMTDPGTDFIRGLQAEELEALVETMFLVAFADGQYGEAERSHFEKCVAMLTSGRMSGESFDHVIQRMVTHMNTVGRDGYISSIKQRLPSPHLRQIALILAMDMAAADGVLHPNERSFIEALGRAFDMNDHATREVLDGPV